MPRSVATLAGAIALSGMPGPPLIPGVWTSHRVAHQEVLSRPLAFVSGIRGHPGVRAVLESRRLGACPPAGNLWSCITLVNALRGKIHWPTRSRGQWGTSCRCT